MKKGKETSGLTTEELDEIKEKVEKISKNIKPSGCELSEPEAIDLLRDLKKGRTNISELVGKIDFNSLLRQINEFRERIKTGKSKNIRKSPHNSKRIKYGIPVSLPFTEQQMIVQEELATKKIREERQKRQKRSMAIKNDQTTGEIEGVEMADKSMLEIVEFLSKKLDGLRYNETASLVYLRKFFEAFPDEQLFEFFDAITDNEPKEKHVRLIRSKAFGEQAKRNQLRKSETEGRKRKKTDPKEQDTIPVFSTTKNRYTFN